MVNYPAPSFPGGTVLTVKRLGERKRHGTRAPGTEHRIGPCDVKWLSSTESNVEGEQISVSAQITAPVGSDVLPSDEIAHPDGRIFRIDGDIDAPVNPFTGWGTGVRFVITHER